ncbi:uncharacterized oxidoreductase YjmC [Prorops nasuta]|uniref:uncharacterized oxidoreductase YjmC n=1 Tax=Prorops nasuta TaxID=863751 RepID=UPI0034CF2535
MSLRSVLRRVSWTVPVSGPYRTRGGASMSFSEQDSSRRECPMVVPKEEVVRFIEECMKKAGTSPVDSRVVAHHLMVADYRGHFSHGMNRMQMYVRDIEKRVTDPKARPKILTDFMAIGLVDGENALGQVVGKECMELAIKKAKDYGIGMVVARGSNHYGICGYYTMMAIEEGMIGFTCTNTSPLMAPTRSKKAALGTNPLSLGMGGATASDKFILDMATTTVALGKVELANRKGQAIPANWAMDLNGRGTTDPAEGLKANLLFPLGGEESSSGYKGYGLATMVEVLSGVLAGANFGPNIRSWKGEDRIANLGQCFMAIDPNAFGPGSHERLSQLLNQLRSLPKSGEKPVMVAGDPEELAMRKVDQEGGISYHPNQIRDSAEFALKIGVEPMKLCPVKKPD